MSDSLKLAETEDGFIYIAILATKHIRQGVLKHNKYRSVSPSV